MYRWNLKVRLLLTTQHTNTGLKSHVEKVLGQQYLYVVYLISCGSENAGESVVQLLDAVKVASQIHSENQMRNLMQVKIMK